MDCIEIVKKAKKGDPKAFSKLIKYYEKDIYRISKAMVKNDDDALDCIQDTILKAYENIKRLKKEEYFKTWLIRILINTCNNLIIARKRNITYIEISEHNQQITEFEKIEIKSVIEKLDDELRTLVMLYYYEDMTIKDMGTTLEIPEGTIKSRLSRARTQLKKFLGIEERGII
ncbi:sigma-70 family RNA polymerase sigma factor [Clostridiaceae bacterium UIB06]|nr:sigma-70 family RNA polymerase sigma factor [Clostridiaceae bacterium UIB06]